MNPKELITKLKQYNAWRRGEHDAQSDPKHISEWIDEACKQLNDKDKRLKDAAKKPQSKQK